MRVIITTILFSPLLLSAQYSTPGTGEVWNLDSLVIHSNGVVTEESLGYHVTADLTISADDLFTVDTDNVYFGPGVLLTVEGQLNIGGFDPIFTSIEVDNVYAGIRIEEGAESEFNFVDFQGGGGIKCISGDVSFVSCAFNGLQHIATSNAALELFTGSPYIHQCNFNNSLGSAISSPANTACSPSISACSFDGNNTENSNRPQVNLGPSGQSSGINFSDNLIQGNLDLDMVGGLACFSIFGDPSDISIYNNIIRDNRYGIAIGGGSTYSWIVDNVIEDNNTQGVPLLGGSGINLNGPSSNVAILEGNEIRNNLWGITVQGEFGVDLGIVQSIDGSQGFNIFSENGNGGQVYALFNNTPNIIWAQNNCWIEGQESTAEQVEDVISHQVDDQELGLVDFSDYLCGIEIIDGLGEYVTASLLLYPNPSSDYITLSVEKEMLFNEIELYTMEGKSIEFQHTFTGDLLDIQSLAPGQYILEFISDDIIKRASFVKQ